MKLLIIRATPPCTRFAGLFVLFALFLSACSAVPAANTPLPPSPTAAPSLTSSPTLTATPLPTGTPTPTPVPTSTPTPAPTPQGGGGKLALTLFQSAYTGKFNLEGDSNVFVVNPDGTELKPVTNGPKGLANLAAAVSPSGDRIAFSQIKINAAYYYRENTAGDLFTVKPDGSGLVQLTSPKLKAYRMGITWLPDNRLLFFGMDEKGMAMFLGDPASAAVTRLSKTSGLPFGGTQVLGFTPDKSGVYWVAGGACADGPICDAQYYLSQLDDSSTKQIWTKVRDAADRVFPSPDGKHFNFFSSTGHNDSNPGWGCFVGNLDGSEIKKVDEYRPYCEGGWSPDGSRFIFETYNAKIEKRYYKIWSAADGKTSDLPDIQTGACGAIHWLSSKSVLFTSCQSNTWFTSIPSASRVLNLESGQLTLLAETGICDFALSPDNRQALFFSCPQGEKNPLAFKVINLQEASVLNDFKNISIPFNVNGVYNKEWQIADYLARSFWIAAPK